MWNARGPFASMMLACAVLLLTLVACLGILHRFAPQLVGVPRRIEVVQSSEHVPPFYKHVFDRAGTNESLRDPVTVVREAGLQKEREGSGPTDLLGLRNRGIPGSADIITIGDSQTYGLGVAFDDAWPQQLQTFVGGGLTVYNMSSSGWGPAQYVAMAEVAGRFRPRVVIVAYYTGNDAHDAFSQAYKNPVWRRLRVSRTLGPADEPRVTWPIDPRDRWEESFGGVRTIFTPAYRREANDRSRPGIREGYDIIAKTATVIARLFDENKVQVLFTVIPTKELVYAERIRAVGLHPPATYTDLVKDESRNLSELADRLTRMRRARYIDVLEPLQHAAAAPSALYPEGTDGHPARGGHAVLARALAGPVLEAWASRRAEASPVAAVSGLAAVKAVR